MAVISNMDVDLNVQDWDSLPLTKAHRTVV